MALWALWALPKALTVWSALQGHVMAWLVAWRAWLRVAVWRQLACGLLGAEPSSTVLGIWALGHPQSRPVD